MKVDFVDELDRAINYVDRSQFIRDAIVEALLRRGIRLSRAALVDLAAAPSRIGKGGRPTHGPQRAALNDGGPATAPNPQTATKVVNYLDKMKRPKKTLKEGKP